MKECHWKDKHIKNKVEKMKSECQHKKNDEIVYQKLFAIKQMKSFVQIQRFGDMLHVFKWFNHLYGSCFVSEDNISIN